MQLLSRVLELWSSDQDLRVEGWLGKRTCDPRGSAQRLTSNHIMRRLIDSSLAYYFSFDLPWDDNFLARDEVTRIWGMSDLLGNITKTEEAVYSHAASDISVSPSRSRNKASEKQEGCHAAHTVVRLQYRAERGSSLGHRIHATYPQGGCFASDAPHDLQVPPTFLLHIGLRVSKSSSSAYTLRFRLVLLPAVPPLERR